MLEWDGENYYVNLPSGMASDEPFLLSTAKSSSEGDLHFKNMLGYIKLTIPENSEWPIKSIEIQAVDNEPLSGSMLIDFSEEEMVWVDSRETFPITCLWSNEPVEPGDYYFHMYPGTFKKGLKFTFHSSDGRIAVKRIQQEVTLEKGVIKDIGVVKDLQNQTDIERDMLIDFYNAAGGDGWYCNTNWCSEKPLNEWYGVEISPEGLVQGLYLDRNNLTGSLEEVLSTLYDLEGFLYLDLRCNYELSGEIPKSISRFGYLNHLILSQCGLKGSIPSEMGEIEGLYVLDLSNCGLEGDIPKSLQDILTWRHSWRYILKGNDFNRDSYVINMPEFNATLDDGTSIDNSYFENNEYTIIYIAGLDCPYTDI